MKRFTIFIIILCIGCSLGSAAQSASSEGVKFYKGSWKNLLNEAQKQGKLIFVDVYTDWCGPCKLMDSETFPLKEVGEVYNNLFVNYKLDAEKGEGIELAKKYAIKAYPTYLFLDGLGNVVARGLDYQDAVPFISLGKRAAAQKSEADNLARFQNRYEQGDRHLDFLKSYLTKRTSLKLDNSELLNTYVSVISDQQLSHPEEILFLSRNMGSTPSKALPLLIANLKLLNPTQKQEVANRLYNNLLYYSFGAALKEQRLEDAGKAIIEINQIEPFLSVTHHESINNIKLLYYNATKDGIRLKELGYALATKKMGIATDTIAKKDHETYQMIMEPFLTGKEDSLKIPGFQEEKKFIIKQYSAGIASVLYNISSAFMNVLDPKDKDLNDAFTWAEYAHKLTPNEKTKSLRDQLKALIE